MPRRFVLLVLCAGLCSSAIAAGECVKSTSSGRMCEQLRPVPHDTAVFTLLRPCRPCKESCACGLCWWEGSEPGAAAEWAEMPLAQPLRCRRRAVAPVHQPCSHLTPLKAPGVAPDKNALNSAAVTVQHAWSMPWMKNLQTAPAPRRCSAARSAGIAMAASAAIAKPRPCWSTGRASPALTLFARELLPRATVCMWASSCRLAAS